LELSERSDAEASAFPMHLLRLADLLGPEIVHRELSSQSLDKVCLELTVNLPLWFRCLLKLSETGIWDDFAYRQSMG
jgi:hypothetical protein